MNDLNPIMQALGRMEGKLDQVIEASKEHREDDNRRFNEVHERLDSHDRDINQAKGAKGAVMWMASGVAAIAGAAATVILKKIGFL